MDKTQKAQFMGCWKLVSYEFRTADGKVMHPWGKAPVGIAIFLDNGIFSAQIMHDGRRKFASATPTADEIKSAFKSYVAYFGKWEINEKDRILINRVEGALNPDWVGGDQIRYIDFVDDRHITLRTEPIKSGKVEITGTISWERMD